MMKPVDKLGLSLQSGKFYHLMLRVNLNERNSHLPIKLISMDMQKDIGRSKRGAGPGFCSKVINVPRNGAKFCVFVTH